MHFYAVYIQWYMVYRTQMAAHNFSEHTVQIPFTACKLHGFQLTYRVYMDMTCNMISYMYIIQMKSLSLIVSKILVKIAF